MPTMDAPVSDESRLDFLDILRGLAVLAIFAVNIKAMLAPYAFYLNASLWTGEHDMTVAAVQAFLIDDKWRTIFTALFGAGIALIADRARERGAGSLGLLSRRLFFLGVFGLVHLLLIWMGDILFTYAVAGFLAIWFRQTSAKALFRWALVCFVISFVWTSLFSASPAFVPELRAELEPVMWGTDPEIIAQTKATMLGGVAGQINARLEEAPGYIFMYYLFGGYWLDTLAIMLAGMWVYRIGFFSATLSWGLYRNAAVVGLLGAFLLDSMRWAAMTNAGWDYGVSSWFSILNQLDGYFGAAGYAGLIGMLVKAGWRPRSVAAAGRMAFTNYIACSLIGTTLAYGHGLGLFMSLTNLQMMYIVGVTWLAILIWSPFWLSAFRFGPLEWLWRSLTYRKLQRFRR